MWKTLVFNTTQTCIKVYVLYSSWRSSWRSIHVMIGQNTTHIEVCYMSPGYPGVKSKSGNWHGIPNLKISIGNAASSTVKTRHFYIHTQSLLTVLARSWLNCSLRFQATNLCYGPVTRVDTPGLVILGLTVWHWP